MTIYEARLSGSNIWIRLDGEPTRMGFYTNRYVRAESEGNAERAAVRLVQEDRRLRALLNAPGDPPMIHCDSLRALDPQPETLPDQQGFSFYEQLSDP